MAKGYIAGIPGGESGGGGGGGISVPSDQIFADTAARDAYFVANPSKLVDGAQAVVLTNPPEGLYQIYDGATWVDHTAVVVGPKGDTGDPGVTINGYGDGGAIGNFDDPKALGTNAYYVAEDFVDPPVLTGSYVGLMLIQDDIDGSNGKLITYYTQEGVFYRQKFAGGWEPWSESHESSGYVKLPSAALVDDELYTIDPLTNRLLSTGVTAKDGTVNMSSGSAVVGDHSIHSIGDNLGVSNTRTSANYIPPWQEIKETGNEGPLRVSFTTGLIDKVRNADTSTTITNPVWTAASQPNDETLFKVKFADVVSAITNVTLFGHIGADEVFKVFLGDLTIGENLKTLRYQLFIKNVESVIVSLTSPDGDVVVKGNALGVPAYTASIREYEEVSEADQINGEISTIKTDITDLQAADQVLQGNIDQKISGLDISDDKGNSFSEIDDINFKGATLENQVGSSLDVTIDPEFSVSNGQEPSSTAFDVKALEFPGATLIQRDPTGANIAVVSIPSEKTPVIVDGTEIDNYDKLEFVDFTQALNSGVLELTPPSPQGNTGITLDNATANIAGVTTMEVPHAVLTNKGSGTVQVEHTVQFENEGGDPAGTNKSWRVFLQPPLKTKPKAGVNDAAEIYVEPGAYEGRVPPSYYASLNEDVSIVGLTNSGVRTGVLWFDNVIKPAGTFIQIDRNSKSIGLQEDDMLDPNVTGGTPYFIYTRISMRGTALTDGYVQLLLRDKLSGDILEDDSGEPLVRRKSYKQGDKLGAIDLGTIKKFTGIEEFQICVDENFGLDEQITIEDRTEGNSCVLVQAIDTSDQTSRGLLQCENDLGKNFEWTSHYIGADFVTLKYFLKESAPLTTIQPGDGELSADGWVLNNFTAMKVGIANEALTLEDDGTNLAGFSFGKVIGAEKTQLLRNKFFNSYITTTTPNGSGRVYAAYWTGKPDEYTKEIITNINPDGELVMGANWVLLGTSIFCTEDASGKANDYSGAFTVPVNANNFAVFFAPSGLQNPNKFAISDFRFDKDPAISGFFLYAPEEGGERHLVEDTRYFKSGLNTEGYASLRYTVNLIKTPMPSGKKLKGAADITANWNGLGAAVDFLTFNADGDATVSTELNIYTGEGVADGGQADAVFTWNRESSPGVWTPIPESELTFTCLKSVTIGTIKEMPTFNLKVKSGDKIRLFAQSEVNDGAFIQTTSPHIYLCETTINFTEFVPGSEDEPLTALYVQDDLGNDWELTAGTDGHLETLLVGDLPENTDHHVLRTNFSGNDFVVDEFGGITLTPKPNPHLSAYMSIDMVYDTELEEKVILFDTVQSASNVTITTPGEITGTVEGLYYGVIKLQVKESSDPTFLTWLEVKPDGGVWQLAPMAEMTINKMKTDTNFTYLVTGMFPISEGDTYRINAMSEKPPADKVELKEVIKTVTLGTITQRSARIDLFRVGDLPTA